MKEFFLTLVMFVLTVTPASSLSYSIHSDGTVDLRDGGVFCSVSRDGTVIKTPLFAFGAVEEGGIIYSLDHPFSSGSLFPSFSSYSPQGREAGAAIRYGGFTLFSFFGERDGGGVIYDGGKWKAGALYASPGEDTDYQKNTVLRTDRSSLWIFGSYDGACLAGRMITSLAGGRSFSPLFKLSLKLPSISITYGCGEVQAFSSSSDGWKSLIAASLSSSSFSVTHELRYERTPVYTGEYRDYEYRIKARIGWGDFFFSDSVTKSFRDGRTKREERIELGWRGVAIGLDAEKRTFSASIEEGGADITWDDGKAGVKITKTIESGRGAFSLSLSSSGVSSWIYTYTL